MNRNDSTGRHRTAAATAAHTARETAATAESAPGRAEGAPAPGMPRTAGSVSERFAGISMNGRMAYVILCTERFLLQEYPDRDWRPIAEVLWRATSENWADWTDEYECYIPDILFSYSHYDAEDFGRWMSEEEFSALRSFYAGITRGDEDDPEDLLNAMLQKPFEMAMVCEGTCIGDGRDSFEIIEETQRLLLSRHIPLPDERTVAFSRSSELFGWGNDFDGRPLSIILNSPA